MPTENKKQIKLILVDPETGEEYEVYEEVKEVKEVQKLQQILQQIQAVDILDLCEDYPNNLHGKKDLEVSFDINIDDASLNELNKLLDELDKQRKDDTIQMLLEIIDEMQSDIDEYKRNEEYLVELYDILLLNKHIEDIIKKLDYTDIIRK